MRLAPLLFAIAVCNVCRADAPPLIAVDVTIVHTSAGDSLDKVSAAGTKIDAAVRELEKAGLVTAISRARLTSTAGQQAMVQVGEQAQVVTGVQRFGPGRQSTVRSRQQVGTLISATANVDDAGRIVLQLQVEKSHFVRTAKKDDEAPVRPEISTVTAQSTIAITDGGSVVVGGMQTTGDNPASTVILASARLLGKLPRKADKKDEVRIFALKHAVAKEAARVLEELKVKVSKVAVDERLNSLIVAGPQEALDVVEALLLRIDQK